MDPDSNESWIPVEMGISDGRSRWSFKSGVHRGCRDVVVNCGEGTPACGAI